MWQRIEVISRRRTGKAVRKAKLLDMAISIGVVSSLNLDKRATQDHMAMLTFHMHVTDFTCRD